MEDTLKIFVRVFATVCDHNVMIRRLNEFPAAVKRVQTMDFRRLLVNGAPLLGDSFCAKARGYSCQGAVGACVPLGPILARSGSSVVVILGIPRTVAFSPHLFSISCMLLHLPLQPLTTAHTHHSSPTVQIPESCFHPTNAEYVSGKRTEIRGKNTMN